MNEIKITMSVARYLLDQALMLTNDGWGERDANGDRLPGIIDDLPMDQNAYRFMGSLLHFIRFVGGLLKHAVEEAEAPMILSNMMLDDDPESNPEI